MYTTICLVGLIASENYALLILLYHAYTYYSSGNWRQRIVAGLVACVAETLC